MFLLLVVWVYFHSLLHRVLLKKLSTVRWFKIIQGHRNQSQLKARMRFPISIPLQLYVNLLSFPGYNDLSVEKLVFESCS